MLALPGHSSHIMPSNRWTASVTRRQLGLYRLAMRDLGCPAAPSSWPSCKLTKASARVMLRYSLCSSTAPSPQLSPLKVRVLHCCSALRSYWACVSCRGSQFLLVMVMVLCSLQRGKSHMLRASHTELGVFLLSLQTWLRCSASMVSALRLLDWWHTRRGMHLALPSICLLGSQARIAPLGSGLLPIDGPPGRHVALLAHSLFNAAADIGVTVEVSNTAYIVIHLS
jgi:hypothetical protein